MQCDQWSGMRLGIYGRNTREGMGYDEWSGIRLGIFVSDKLLVWSEDHASGIPVLLL